MADTPITISKLRVSPAELPERILGYSHKFNVKFSDIACGTTNADTVTVTLGTTPTNWACTRAIVNVVTAFAGVSALNIIVGSTTGTSAFVASASVLTQGLKQNTTGANTTGTIASSTGSAAVVYKAVFTGGIPSTLSAGECNIYLNIIDLDQLP